MKFGPDVLAEIVSIVFQGLQEDMDVSQMLRDIDVVVDDGYGDKTVGPETVVLSDEYRRLKMADRG